MDQDIERTVDRLVSRRWQYISEAHLYGGPAYRVGCPACSWELPDKQRQPSKETARQVAEALHPRCPGQPLEMPLATALRSVTFDPEPDERVVRVRFQQVEESEGVTW